MQEHYFTILSIIRVWPSWFFRSFIYLYWNSINRPLLNQTMFFFEQNALISHVFSRSNERLALNSPNFFVTETLGNEIDCNRYRVAQKVAETLGTFWWNLFDFILNGCVDMVIWTCAHFGPPCNPQSAEMVRCWKNTARHQLTQRPRQ